MKLFKVTIYSFIILLCAGCNQNQDNSNEQIHHPIESNPPFKITPNESDPNKTIPSKNEQIQEQAATTTISQIVSGSKTGKAHNIPFVASHNTISDVKKDWGNPDRVDKAGNGLYATYTKKQAAFGYTKDGRIFDVRSYDRAIQKLTLSSIEQVMGPPFKTSVNNTDDIYTYKVNSQFQLKWIIPKETGKAHHISVYSPSDINTGTVGAPNKYLLEIKGTSQNISKPAWQRMLQWRDDILAFPNNYPNDVFVNGPNKKMVALTFDDGPDRIVTPGIIAALKKHNVKGTFFFIGEKVQKNPDVVKSAYDNGNVIASHSFYHHELPRKSDAEIDQDLAKTSEAIHQVIGQSPVLFRPPYGETDVKLVKVAAKNDYKIILWSLDTLDWSQREQVHIQKNVFDNVRNGDIILMHSDEDKTETAKAVPVIIEELKSRGFQIVDVSTLLNTKAYK
ncbi:hypothetical protein CU633_16725 [Bacillus sp. V3-13]|uniref:polysaccharide deacetylase family protein n=1 Tax=Bacillus sp. V3-13 TaxID=2053728 RepID=UPI000C7576C4|nr:polysaccharide deacetylase family protein [Bacillus sp. V3-13]PLR76331.1 hypothetical protein CU633_16725 [Bacillus sp. V3-13]